MSDKTKAKNEDEEGDETPQGYIFVVGGKELRTGQVALAEVDPAHPFVPSMNPNKQGENQAYVVKGQPGKWVGRTREVSKAISRGFLREATAPRDIPMPDPDRPATSSSMAASAMAARREQTGAVGSGVSDEEVQAQIDAAVAKVQADAQAQLDALQADHDALLTDHDNAQATVADLKTEIANRDQAAQEAAMEEATRPDAQPAPAEPPSSDAKPAKPKP